MKLRSMLLAASLLAIPAQASAGLVSVIGGVSSLGVGPEILAAAPADVNDDAATNTHMQGFNERQDFMLDMVYSIDGGGTLAAGTRVSSHMIFLNSVTNLPALTHNDVAWTFDGDIIGVMSNSDGSFEVASSDLMGAVGTSYPIAVFAYRGLEGGDDYSVSGNTLTASLRVTEPGDWMRVITVSAVPVPPALPLFGTALAVLGFMGWRRKQKAA